MLKQKTVDSVCLSARRCCCILGIRLWVSVKYLETIWIETSKANKVKSNQILHDIQSSQSTIVLAFSTQLLLFCRYFQNFSQAAPFVAK